MSSQREVKIVTRQETFNDLAVRELAKSRSACICKIQFGRCKKRECMRCPIGRQYANCYIQLNDYDKLRLSEYVSQAYLRDSAEPEQWTSPGGYIWHAAKNGLMMLGGFIFLAFIVSVVLAFASQF